MFFQSQACSLSQSLERWPTEEVGVEGTPPVRARTPGQRGLSLGDRAVLLPDLSPEPAGSESDPPAAGGTRT